MHIEITLHLVSVLVGYMLGTIITFILWFTIDEQMLNKHRYHIGWNEGWHQGWDSHKSYIKETETEVKL